MTVDLDFVIQFLYVYIGPERNSIQEKLINVDWRVLTDQLDLTSQTRSIHGACYKELDAVTCYLREIIGRFIDSQPSEVCNKTVEKIAIALEKLGRKYWKEVHELRRMIATGELCVHVLLKTPATIASIHVYMTYDTLISIHT